jgi:hypothetical protein
MSSSVQHELDEHGLPRANPSPVESHKSGDSFIEKCKKQPLVPLFAVGTLGVLGYGLMSFRGAEISNSQRAMRLRVVAQGATLAAMVGYLGFVGEGPIGEIMNAIKEKSASSAPIAKP